MMKIGEAAAKKDARASGAWPLQAVRGPTATANPNAQRWGAWQCAPPFDFSGREVSFFLSFSLLFSHLV